MEIKQFEDKNLAHFSYAILSNCKREIILIDPSRDTQVYLEYAKENEAQITGVIETHAHADFVSSHLELHELTGATIYVSEMLKAAFPHQSFNEGQQIEIGKIRLTAINTPGHSPDGICVVLEHTDKKMAVFTGDTLFIGDCGRPDLREENGNEQFSREVLARQLYHSLQNKLKVLPDDVIVYPAHGAGTLCGKSLSDANSSTIGKEKESNWSLQFMTEDDFVQKLLIDQPFVPLYFPFDVMLNINGAPKMHESIETIKITAIKNETDEQSLNADLWIIDARTENVFKEGHLKHSINIMNQTKFETWLGSIIHPKEEFYLGSENETQLRKLMVRCAAIGYESQIKEALIIDYSSEHTDKLDIESFRKNTDAFTIIDVRNDSEVADNPIFSDSLIIPLPELRNRFNEIPTNKPLVVHCSSGFRSAAGSSLLQAILNDVIKVYDMGEAVKSF
ncbi:MAG: MBL fold metallo-hydrolase [Chitinophagaceae bacterium]